METPSCFRHHRRRPPWDILPGNRHAAVQSRRLSLESLEERTLLSAGPIPITDFPGLPEVNGAPPDPVTAAGPESLVAMVNTQLGLFTKQGDELDRADFRDFFDDVDHGFDIFDPWTFYDRYSDRFVVMAAEAEGVITGGQGSHAYYLIGVSATSTPDDFDTAVGDTDNDWYVYSVSVAHDFGGGLAFNDKPKIAADADSFYLTANFLEFPGGIPQGNNVLITRLNKIPMLSGTLGSQVDREVRDIHSLVPAQSIGRSASQPQLFIVRGSNSVGTTGLHVYALDDSNNVTHETFLATSFFSPAAVPQQGTTNNLYHEGTQLINAVWRNDSLWTTHTVATGSNGGDAKVRWYEVDTTGGSYSIVQQGDIDPGPGIGTFLPSIAVDVDGNMAVTYTQSSARQFPNMMVAGRRASDPLSYTTPGVVVHASPTYYDPLGPFAYRWGDYSGIAVDPADDRTFWAFNEYAATTTTWGTWWGAFGFDTASIYGTVWQDLNGDGTKDDDEPNTMSWPVFLDGNDNGVIDEDLVATVASPDVPIAIPDLGLVTSRLQVDGLAGLISDVDVTLNISHPYDDDLDVFLYSPSGTRVELFTDVGAGGDNFTNTTLDDSAATAITAGSAPFSGSYHPEGSLSDFAWERPDGTWTLEVTDDAGGDVGTLNSWSLTITYGDTLLLTSLGNYVFTNLPPGHHVVREVPQPDWLQTAPFGGAHVLDLAPGQAATGVNFGNAEPATIGGTKWHDLDGDGTRDDGEPGLAGWTVFLDVDRNGTSNQAVYVPASTTPLPIPDLQTVNAFLEVPELGGLLQDVDVSLSIEHTFDADLDIALISPFGTKVALASNRGGSGDNFSATVFDDEASTPIADGVPPFAGSFQPEGSLADLDGQWPSGVWTLRITDGTGGDIGTLVDWSLTLTYGDPTAQTDANGGYQFTGIAPGAYVIREESQPGWVRTEPTKDVLYGAADTENTQLLVIDPTTGGAVPVGPTGVDGLMGLASDGVGTLYSIPLSGNIDRQLQSVNPITGQATPLLSVGATSFGEGGLALTPDDAFVYGTRAFLESPPELFRIDLNTQAISFYGTLNQGGTPLPAGAQVDGLAFRDWMLYGLVTESTGSLNDHLVMIDTTTLHVTDVGALGTDIGFLAGLAYDPDADLFYASGMDNNQLYAVAPETGVATLIGATGLGRLSGLAYGSTRGTPWAGTHLVFAGSDANITGVDFGNAQRVDIRGTKWHDLEGNGPDGGDPPLDGWTVYLDQNLNGVLDQDTTIVHAADAPKALPDFATTLSTLSVHGITGTITDLNVTVDIDHTFDGDLEAILISPGGTGVQLFDRVGGAGDDFTSTTLDDEAATPIGAGTPPFTGHFQPVDPLAILDGQNPNGIWTLEITDHAQGDVGTLNGWSFDLTTAEPSMEVNPVGEYLFEGRRPGSYTVREVHQPGWLQTYPGVAPVVLDDFEDGNVSEYTVVVPGTGGSANSFAAHDGIYGGVGRDWMYRDDPAAHVQRGDVISSWVRFANNAAGQAWLGFGASANGTLALVLDADTGQLRLRDNPFYNWFDLAARPQSYQADHWYRTEVVWGTGGAIEGRLFDSDGTTLLSTVRAIDTVTTAGGIALRGDGVGSIRQFDTITIQRNGAHSLVLTSGEDANEVDFGNAQPSELRGMKYHDLNGNGHFDGGEPGLPGWSVFLDVDNDSLADGDIATLPSVDVPKSIPDNSTIISALPVAGLSGLLLDVDVTLNITHPFDGDLDISLISPRGTRVELFSHVGAGGANFTGTTLDDEAAVPITAGTAPFLGSYRPEGELASFDYQNPNGVWLLEVTDDMILDVGSLGSWSLTLTFGDPAATTDSGGHYAFGNLTPGEYVVREFQQPGWIQTAPPAGFHDVGTVSGQPFEGADFGNRLPWLTIDDVAVTEGNSGTHNLDFTVTLMDPSDLTVVVNYQTADDTARVADGDYDAAAGQLTFVPLAPLAQPISVVIHGDVKPEGNERFFVDLFGPANATLRRAQGTGTILNDEAFLLGDVNGDGNVDGLDVQPFVDVLINGPYNPAADMNQDGQVNGLDVDPFVAAVVSGSASPAVAGQGDPAGERTVAPSRLDVGPAVACTLPLTDPLHRNAREPGHGNHFQATRSRFLPRRDGPIAAGAHRHAGRLRQAGHIRGLLANQRLEPLLHTGAIRRLDAGSPGWFTEDQRRSSAAEMANGLQARRPTLGDWTANVDRAFADDTSWID